MEAETFSNAGVVEFSNRTFVNVHLRTDMDKAVAERYKVGPIPVTFLLSPVGEPVSTFLGYLPPEDYRRALEKALVAHKKLVEFAPKLKAAPEDPALLSETAGLYEDLGDSKKAADVLGRAAAKTAGAKEHGALLLRAFKLLNDLDSDDEVNASMSGIADRLDALDADGKLGLKDDAAYVRAMVDCNKESLDAALKKLEELVSKWPDGDRAPDSLLVLANIYHHAKEDNAKAEKILRSMMEKYAKTEFADRAKAMLEHMKKHAEKGK